MDKVLTAAVAVGVTVEDLARAWASIDGKRDSFDKGKADAAHEREHGHYGGYYAEAREMVGLAIEYAKWRGARQ